MLVTFKAKADACPTVNQSIIEDFNSRKEEVTHEISLISFQVAHLTRLIEEKQEQLTEMRDKMLTTKASWYGRIVEVVAKMNASFSKAFASI